jgi:hypothetical protein
MQRRDLLRRDSKELSSLSIDSSSDKDRLIASASIANSSSPNWSSSPDTFFLASGSVNPAQRESLCLIAHIRMKVIRPFQKLAQQVLQSSPKIDIDNCRLAPAQLEHLPNYGAYVIHVHALDNPAAARSPAPGPYVRDRIQQ